MNLLALGSPVPGAMGSWLDAHLASGLVEEVLVSSARIFHLYREIGLAARIYSMEHEIGPPSARLKRAFGGGRVPS